MPQLQITALEEIPAPPGSVTVRIEAEIETPAADDDDEAAPASDPVDDALSGVARAGVGLVAGVGKMVSGVVRALASDDDEKDVD